MSGKLYHSSILFPLQSDLSLTCSFVSFRVTDNDHSYSYDSDTGILSINEMASHLHDNVRDEIRDLIDEQLKLIRKRDDVRGAYMRQIRTRNSNPITIMKAGNEDSDSASEGDKIIDLKQYPDAQFRHIKGRCPGVVIEVSLSQKWEDVRVKAYKLLVKSQGQVGTVINVDYPDHLNSREATLSVWRRTWENGMMSPREDLIREVQSCPFIRSLATADYEPAMQQICRPDGTPVTTDKALCISLLDFASPELHGKTEDLVLSFPYRDLGTAVARARREADEWTKEDNVDPKPVPVDMTAIPAEVAAAFALDPEMD